jgi:hypothetical protein
MPDRSGSIADARIVNTEQFDDDLARWPECGVEFEDAGLSVDVDAPLVHVLEHEGRSRPGPPPRIQAGVLDVIDGEGNLHG